MLRAPTTASYIASPAAEARAEALLVLPFVEREG
jgi:hypothetical protein